MLDSITENAVESNAEPTHNDAEPRQQDDTELTQLPDPMCSPACGQASLGHQRIPLRRL
jgi:hypothetical protein